MWATRYLDAKWWAPDPSKWWGEEYEEFVEILTTVLLVHLFHIFEQFFEIQRKRYYI